MRGRSEGPGPAQRRSPCPCQSQSQRGRRRPGILIETGIILVVCTVMRLCNLVTVALFLGTNLGASQLKGRVAGTPVAVGTGPGSTPATLTSETRPPVQDGVLPPKLKASMPREKELAKIASTKASPSNSNALKDRYTKIKKLGEGGFGLVYRAVETATGNRVAIKRLLLEEDDLDNVSLYGREIALLRRLRHPNIIRLYATYHGKRKLTLVLEHLSTDVMRYLNKRFGRRPENTMRTAVLPAFQETVKDLMYQLLQGVAFIHSHQVIHRDLKPENLLMDKNGVLKIIDFGLARSVSTSAHDYMLCGTYAYIPPDMHLGNRDYSTASDMWSVGCIFAELINGRGPFGHSGSILEDIQQALGPLDSPTRLLYDNYPLRLPPMSFLGKLLGKARRLKSLVPALDADGQDLLGRFLCYDPAARISASEALKHRYFDSVRNKHRYVDDAVPEEGSAARGSASQGETPVPTDQHCVTKASDGPTNAQRVLKGWDGKTTNMQRILDADNGLTSAERLVKR